MSPHLAAALAAVGDRLPPERIDQVWLFPARQTGDRETGLAVLAAFPDDGGSPERRAVWTLGYEAEQLKGGKSRRVDALLEQAVAPAGRVERVIEGVLRRLGSDTEVPELRSIGGDPSRWAELLAEGDVVLD
ncbi:MAG: hypothetical protein JO040_06650 [Gemmatimonadetes bacterium]|nr:hypothetical protein [Gemmatimonadota bacterium]